jgi:hypothetical protein
LETDKGRMPYRACGPFLLALLLTGCDQPSRPSGAENRQLENAAQMLDRAPARLENIDENALEDFEPQSDPFEGPS